MTWIKFALWVTVIYTIYYGVIFLFDYLRSRGKTMENGVPELSFIDDITPARVDPPKTDAEHPVSAVIASGGVVLKQMFGLAREEAVEFTRAVSF